VLVIARLTVPNGRGQRVTLADTAVVNVNTPPTARVFTQLAIVTPGDSAKYSYGMDSIKVRALDANGVVMSAPNDSINFFLWSSNTMVTQLGNGMRNPTRLQLNVLPGNIMLYASATIYGVTITDSLPVRVGTGLFQSPPISLDTQIVVGSATPLVTISALTVRVGVGGVVRWQNNTNRTVDLVFDDSTAPQAVPAVSATSDLGKALTNSCFNGLLPIPIPGLCAKTSNGGNVLLPPATNATFSDGVGRELRRFTAVGTYPFHSTLFPTVSGRIIVEP
jgi:hypothetical protein